MASSAWFDSIISVLVNGLGKSVMLDRVTSSAAPAVPFPMTADMVTFFPGSLDTYSNISVRSPLINSDVWK